jgi:hypothetical protein
LEYSDLYVLNLSALDLIDKIPLRLLVAVVMVVVGGMAGRSVSVIRGEDFSTEAASPPVSRYERVEKIHEVAVMASLTTDEMTTPSAGLVTPEPSPHVVAEKQTKATEEHFGPETITPTDLPPREHFWPIRSVSSMKQTKDRICNQAHGDYIGRWVSMAKKLGANYVAVETPYDNPGCGNSVAYTDAWVKEIRKQGLRVWHRHMPLAHEGIYDTPKQKVEFKPMITDYIRSNRQLFAAGDIFTPIPEPQNGGIHGVTHCSQGLCQYDSKEDFNRWLREVTLMSRQVFTEIGFPEMKVGYFGFDGFVAWGDNNPDWTGILEDETVRVMGNITIDHYAEAVGSTMRQDLAELKTRFPGVPIVIGEWGTITGGDVEAQVRETMQAARDAGVIGFNYWHLGSGGNEALIDDNFNPRPHFDEVQAFFSGIGD